MDFAVAGVAVVAAVAWAPLAWACCLVAAADAADAVEATDPAGYGARLLAAGSTPVNLKTRRRAGRSSKRASFLLEAHWATKNLKCQRALSRATKC